MNTSFTEQMGGVDEVSRFTFPEVVIRLRDLVANQLAAIVEETPGVASIIERVIADFEAQGEAMVDFVMTGANYTRLVMCCVLDPEGYGIRWGWMEAEVLQIDEWNERVRETVNRYFSQRVREITETEAQISGQSIIDFINSDRVGAGEREAVIGGGIVNFLNGENEMDIDTLIEMLEKPQDHPRMVAYPSLKTRFAAGKLKEYKRKIVTQSKDAAVVGRQNDLRDSMTVKIQDAESYQEIYEIASLFIQTDDIEVFMSFIPNRFKQRGQRFQYLNDDEVHQLAVRRQMVMEGRYIGPDYFPGNFFEQNSRSPFARWVPKDVETGTYAIVDEDFEASGRNPDDYFRMEGQGLLYNLSRREIDEINRRIDYAREHGTEFIMFVPTCPCDQHTLVNNESIRFVGGPIIGEIAWPGLNNIDAVTVMAKHLENLGVKTRVVFGTGDMEHDSGNTRDMTYEDFMAAFDQTHSKVFDLATRRLGVDVERSAVTMAHEHITRYQVETGGSLNIEVAGITQIVGGIDVFKMHKDGWRDAIDKFWEDEDNQPLIEKVIFARSRYYEMVVSNNHKDMTDENERMAKKRDYLKRDILDYVTFHSIISQGYGNDRMIIVAGDSHPLEALAAEIVGTCLVPVHGNYDGAKFLS